MNEYKQSYLTLFNGVTDALEALRKQNYGYAEVLLMQAQSKAEEMFIGNEE